MSRSRTHTAELVALLAALPASCTTRPSEPVSTVVPTARVSASATGRTVASAPAASSAASTRVVAFPHDVTSFTEGLVYHQGAVYESTGLYGESKLRKVDLTSGRVLAQVRLTDAYFGEGLALLNGELFQLTYREGRCFVYDAATLSKKRELAYEGEGWGLTTDGTHFIMSDGSDTLAFRDAATFQVTRRLPVTGPNGRVNELNELEWVRGFIVANVWGTDFILRIDPATGRVVESLDLAYLPEPRRGVTPDDVLNGIAYDDGGGRLLVTGKRWSQIFELPVRW